MINKINGWEKAKIIRDVISTILIPLIIFIVGNSLTTSLKRLEIEANFVQLALEILREEPSVNNKNLREWATKVINNYSEVKLSETIKKELIDSIFLPNENNECASLMLKGLSLYNARQYNSAISYFNDAKDVCKDKKAIEEFLKTLK
jgi:hypothetical protein